jgi:amidase
VDRARQSRLQYSVARTWRSPRPRPESERQWAALARSRGARPTDLAAARRARSCACRRRRSGAAQGLSLPTLEPVRARIPRLAAPTAADRRFPQLSLPGRDGRRAAVGLSISGARGSDAALVAVAQAMEARR